MDIVLKKSFYNSLYFMAHILYILSSENLLFNPKVNL